MTVLDEILINTHKDIILGECPMLIANNEVESKIIFVYLVINSQFI